MYAIRSYYDLLPPELICAQDLGVDQTDTVQLDRRASLQVANPDIPLHGMAASKSIAVQKDIMQHSPALYSRKDIPDNTVGIHEISGAGKARPDARRPEILFDGRPRAHRKPCGSVGKDIAGSYNFV